MVPTTSRRYIQAGHSWHKTHDQDDVEIENRKKYWIAYKPPRFVDVVRETATQKGAVEYWKKSLPLTNLLGISLAQQPCLHSLHGAISSAS